MEEVWKDIEGYEGIYQVSNLGRVRSVDRVVHRTDPRHGKPISFVLKGTIMKPQLNKKTGYLSVHLKVIEPFKTGLIHRLVGKAFIPNPDNLPEINHKNRFRDDNRAVNLEWCTKDYNVNYDGAKQRGAEKRFIKVEQLDLKGNHIQTYNSITEAAKAVNGSTNKISFCCLGKRQKHKGYRWQYAKE